MTRVNNTPTTPARTSVEPTLSNYPVDAVVTFAVNGETPLIYNFEDENDVRNFLARLVPTSIIEANPEEVLTHLNDTTNGMFDDLLKLAKQEGLALPTGI